MLEFLENKLISEAASWWHHHFCPIDDDDVIYGVLFSLCFKVIPLNLRHVKSLIINTPLFYADAKVLNLFKQLEQLEYRNWIWQQIRPPQIILPRLKVLKIGWAAYNHDGFTIDAPQLEILSCYIGLSGINFPHSKSIKRLQIGDTQHDLKKFENVEVFSCFTSESVVIDLLEQLPKLKEIHFVAGQFKDICAKYLNYNETEYKMQWLIERKRLLGKKELKLHFLGELLDDDAKTFKDYNFDVTFKQIFKDFQ